MRQSTRGDVQWSGGTSDPSGLRSRNFVRSPSGTASALVWHLTLRTALRSSHQSIRRDRVSGCPAWSEGHSFCVETTMTHPPAPQAKICVRRLRRPGHALRACMRAPLSDCVLAAGPTEADCYFGTALASESSAISTGGGVPLPLYVSSSECGALWRIG